MPHLSHWPPHYESGLKQVSMLSNSRDSGRIFTWMNLNWSGLPIFRQARCLLFFFSPHSLCRYFITILSFVLGLKMQLAESIHLSSSNGCCESLRIKRNICDRMGWKIHHKYFPFGFEEMTLLSNPQQWWKVSFSYLFPHIKREKEKPALSSSAARHQGHGVIKWLMPSIPPQVLQKAGVGI